LLRAGAIADQFTGTVPNTTWGFGKLRINNAVGFITSTNEEQPLPLLTVLDQNYPNPFNPSTTIRFTLTRDERVKLRVFNVLGQLVRTAFDGPLIAGTHEVVLDLSDVSSGMYMYRLETLSVASTRKLVLLR
jgi:hypothetical protein